MATVVFISKISDFDNVFRDKIKFRIISFKSRHKLKG